MPHFVDGHQHCHVVPAVREALAAVFAAAGVRVTRVPSERKPPITLCPLCSVVDIEAEQARPPSLHAPLLLPLLLHFLLVLLDARAPPAPAHTHLPSPYRHPPPLASVVAGARCLQGARPGRWLYQSRHTLA